MALGLAAMRGIKVDIVLPEHSNHAILDWARRSAARPLIEAGCRIWLLPRAVRSFEADDDRRLLVLVGSANWDMRSFRLNFELNVELHDADFAARSSRPRPPARRLTLADIDGDPLPIRLRNSAARLLQPYL